MAIQLQVLGVYPLTSQKYMLQCINKKAPNNMLSRSKFPKTNHDYGHARKTSELFYDTTWEPTLAPAIIFAN